MSEETGPLAHQASATAVVDAPAPPVGQGHDGEGHGEHAHGLSDWGYVRIFIALVFITGLEVLWSYLPTFKHPTGNKHILFIAGLMVMMTIKFVVVASNFMHLRFDNKLLTRVFYAGLVLAVCVYLAVLITFHHVPHRP